MASDDEDVDGSDGAAAGKADGGGDLIVTVTRNTATHLIIPDDGEGIRISTNLRFRI